MGTKGATFYAGPGTYGRNKVDEMDFGVETYIDRKMEFIPVHPFKKMCGESDRTKTTHDLLLETRSSSLTKGHDHSNGSGGFESDDKNSSKFQSGTSKPASVAKSEIHDRTDESTRSSGETLSADIGDESFIDHKMELIFVDPRPTVTISLINTESRCILTRPDILGDTVSRDMEPATMTGHPGNDSKPVHHRGKDGTEDRRNIKSDLASNGLACGPGGYGSTASDSMSMGKYLAPGIGDKACSVSVPKGTSGQDRDKGSVASDRTSVSITGIGKYPSGDNEDETSIGSVTKGTLGAVLTAAPGGNESTSFNTKSIGKSLRAEIGDETFIDRKMEVIPFEPGQKINKVSIRIQTGFELPVGASPFTAVINPAELPEDDSRARNGHDIDVMNAESRCILTRPDILGDTMSRDMEPATMTGHPGNDSKPVHHRGKDGAEDRRNIKSDLASDGPGCGLGDYDSKTSVSMSLGKSMTPGIGDKACSVSVPKGTSGQDRDEGPVASDRTSVSITAIGKYSLEDNEDETSIGSVAKGTLGAAPGGNESTSFNTTSIGKSLRAEIGDETFIDRKMEVIPVEPAQKITKGSMRVQTSIEFPAGGSPFMAVINPVELPENDSRAKTGQDIEVEHKVPVGASYSRDHERAGFGRSLTAEIGDETFIDRKMEFIHADNLEKVKVCSSTICYDS